MKEGLLVNKEVYNNLMRYFEAEDWLFKKSILAGLEHQVAFAGSVLFLKGDRSPQTAHIIASGKIALFKGIGTRVSSKKQRENMLFDHKFAAAVFFQYFCDRLDKISRQEEESEDPNHLSTAYIEDIIKRANSEVDLGAAAVEEEETNKVWFSGLGSAVLKLVRRTDLMRIKTKHFLQKMIDLNLMEEVVPKQELQKALASNFDLQDLIDLLLRRERFKILILEKNHGTFITCLEAGSFFGDRIFGQDSERMATAIPIVTSDLLTIGKTSYLKTFRTAIEKDMDHKMEIVKSISPHTTQAFSRRHVWNIIYASTISEFKKGDLIMREGAPKSGSVGYLLEGAAEVSRQFDSLAFAKLAVDPSPAQVSVLGDRLELLEQEHRKRLLAFFNEHLESPLETQDIVQDVTLNDLGLLQPVSVESVCQKRVYMFSCRAKEATKVLYLDKNDLRKFFPQSYIDELVEDFYTTVEGRFKKFEEILKRFVVENDKNRRAVNSAKIRETLGYLVKGVFRGFSEQVLKERKEEMKIDDKSLDEDEQLKQFRIEEVPGSKKLKYIRQFVREKKALKLIQATNKDQSTASLIEILSHRGKSKNKQPKTATFVKGENPFPWLEKNFQFQESKEFTIKLTSRSVSRSVHQQSQAIDRARAETAPLHQRLLLRRLFPKSEESKGLISLLESKRGKSEESVLFTQQGHPRDSRSTREANSKPPTRLLQVNKRLISRRMNQAKFSVNPDFSQVKNPYPSNQLTLAPTVSRLQTDQRSSTSSYSIY